MKVTLTLELDYNVAEDVLHFLQHPHAGNFIKHTLTPISDTHSSSSEPKVTLEDTLVETPKETPQEAPTVTKPTAGKKTTMPTFGRSQSQVDTYESSEEARVELLDEKAAIKAEKQADADALEAVQVKEVTAIKEATEIIKPSKLPPKPWVL